jgi:eukaryotic-like serine/threonine-protein kinase
MTAPGTLLAGKYELLEIAGKGGMATVWRANVRGTAGFLRPVAVKMMLPRLCNDPHFVALFVEEARVCSQLSHPNVTQIYDFGSDESGVHYLVMEWVDGMDLLDYVRSFVDRGFFTPWAAIAMIGLEVLRGLHAAHDHLGPDSRPSPIFHRDVTPHNILLGTNGAVKLTDFGLAKAGDRGSMTLPHVVKGKISYTAPEMTRGVKANVRTDLFSLGVTLWEALAGRKMFDAPTPLQIVRQIQAWNIPPLESIRKDLPAELLQLIAIVTSRDPEERFASAQQMARELARLLPPAPDVSRLGRSVADARIRARALAQQVVTAEELGSALEELSTAHEIPPQPSAPAQPAFSLPSPTGAARAARLGTPLPAAGRPAPPAQPAPAQPVQPAARLVPAATGSRRQAPAGYGQRGAATPGAAAPGAQRPEAPPPAAGAQQPAARQPAAGAQQPAARQPASGAQQPVARQPAAQPQAARSPVAAGQQPVARQPTAQPQAARPPVAAGQQPAARRPLAEQRAPAARQPAAPQPEAPQTAARRPPAEAQRQAPHTPPPEASATRPTQRDRAADEFSVIFDPAPVSWPGHAAARGAGPPALPAEVPARAPPARAPAPTAPPASPPPASPPPRAAQRGAAPPVREESLEELSAILEMDDLQLPVQPARPVPARQPPPAPAPRRPGAPPQRKP